MEFTAMMNNSNTPKQIDLKEIVYLRFYLGLFLF